MSLQDLCGIELPIVQAPMAGSQGSALAIAVARGGGLGSLPCALLSIEAMRTEIAALRSGTTKPFNVNFFCHSPPQLDEKREAAWRELLAPHFAELGVDVRDIATPPARVPFNREMAELIAELKPAVVSFHFGLPSIDLLAHVRSCGAKIISSATTVDEAIWLEARGVDAVIAQGAEAGGHRGLFLTNDISTQVGTFALVPQVVRALKIPVIAAGGIADANGVAAAIKLGATGVQVGTAYLLCAEAMTSRLHRDALKSVDARTTALTNVFTGRPARGIVNRIMRDIGPMNVLAPDFPLASVAMSALRAKAELRGSSDFSPLWCGQNASGCTEQSATALTRTLAGV